MPRVKNDNDNNNNKISVMIIIVATMFMVLSSWHDCCKNSLRSFDQRGTSPRSK